MSLVTLIAITLAAGSLGGWGSLAALGLLLPLVSLPFGLLGQRLSRSYGLSRQTTWGWIADWLKGVALSDLLGALAAVGLLACQRQWPHGWPLPAWLLAVGLGLILAAAWPVVLLPIFLRSRPLDSGPLADALSQTAAQAGVAVRELRLLHGLRLRDGREVQPAADHGSAGHRDRALRDSSAQLRPQS